MIEVQCNVPCLSVFGVELDVKTERKTASRMQENVYVSLQLRVQNRRKKNGISRLISALCVNCLISILEYFRIIDYSIIWMCIWCGLLQKLHKIKKSELLNSKVSSKLKQFSNIPENFRTVSTQESGYPSGTDHFRT